MGLLDKKENTGSEFQNFFMDELKDIYWAENHLVKALEKLQKASTSPELKAAFEKHTRETRQHIATVEEVFEILGSDPEEKKCEAMAGLLKEADTIISDTEKDTFTRDAALILAVQKVEHYEIATYGTLRIFAGYLNNDKVVSLLLEQVLANEKTTDMSLTVLAEDHINSLAATE